MTENEIKEFFKLYKKLNSLAKEIFDKFKEANLLDCSMNNPHYDRIVFDNNESNLIIRYFDDDYDTYDYEYLKIPYRFIYDNSVDEYIKSRKDERAEILRIQKQKEEENRLKWEKAEYERLKAKFENE